MKWPYERLSGKINKKPNSILRISSYIVCLIAGYLFFYFKLDRTGVIIYLVVGAITMMILFLVFNPLSMVTSAMNKALRKKDYPKVILIVEKEIEEGNTMPLFKINLLASYYHTGNIDKAKKIFDSIEPDGLSPTERKVFLFWQEKFEGNNHVM